jgi:hypothetical protein
VCCGVALWRVAQVKALKATSSEQKDEAVSLKRQLDVTASKLTGKTRLCG